MSDLAQRRRVLIMRAAGCDFHNFLCCYRDDPQIEEMASPPWLRSSLC